MRNGNADENFACRRREKIQHTSVLDPKVLIDRPLLDWVAQLADCTPQQHFKNHEELSKEADRSSGKLPDDQQPSTDPFAFNAAAFNTDSSGRKEQPEEQATDPFAFDPGAFGRSDGQSSQAVTNPSAADPYAFDMGAFGASEEPPAQISAPKPGDRGGAADPFAFDASAFESSNDQQPGSEDQKAGKDPFEFDGAAFEASAGGGREPEAQGRAEDPFQFSMEAFEPSAPGANRSQASATQPSTADPFAFDMAAFEDPGALQPPKSEPASTPAPQNQKPFGQHEKPALPPSGKGAAATHGKAVVTQRAQTPLTKSDFKAPEKAAFQPLSGAEFQGVKKLLQRQQEPISDGDEDVGEAKSQPPYGRFKLGRESAERLLKFAEVLTAGTPGSLADAPALDAAAQRAAAYVQVLFPYPLIAVNHVFRPPICSRRNAKSKRNAKSSISPSSA